MPREMSNRREAIKTLTAITAGTVLSLRQWEKPLVRVGTLPVYAQASGVTLTCEVDSSDWGINLFRELTITTVPGVPNAAINWFVYVEGVLEGSYTELHTARPTPTTCGSYLPMALLPVSSMSG